MKGLTMKNLFNKKITPACKYCKIGKTSINKTILCVKYGVTTNENYCKKFKYNPLKRIPKTIKILQNIDETII